MIKNAHKRVRRAAGTPQTGRAAIRPARSTRRNGHNVAEDTKTPNNPPMPYTTKKRSGRKKLHWKGTSPRKPNAVALIYRNTTEAIIADKETEARLSAQGPPNTPRSSDMVIHW